MASMPSPDALHGNLKENVTMAMTHACPGEAVDVRPLGTRLAAERTSALFKSEHLEVLRLVLKAGQVFPPHKVPGDITIQCIEGRLDVTAGERVHRLEPGQLLYLAGNCPHGVAAVQDASALVTIALGR